MTVQAPVSPLNHAGAQNARSRSRLVMVVVVVMVAVHVVAVKTGMVATMMRCRRRLLSRVGGHRRVGRRVLNRRRRRRRHRSQ